MTDRETRTALPSTPAAAHRAWVKPVPQRSRLEYVIWGTAILFGSTIGGTLALRAEPAPAKAAAVQSTGAGASTAPNAAGSTAAPTPPGGAASSNPAGAASSNPAGAAGTNPAGGTATTNPAAGASAANPAGGAAANPAGGTATTNPAAGASAANAVGGAAPSNPASGAAAPNATGGSSATDPAGGASTPNPAGGVASVPDPARGSSATNPGAAAPAAAQAATVETAARAARTAAIGPISDALRRFVSWSHSHAGARCPDVVALGAPPDPWGHALRITCTDQPADQIAGVVSAGRDGVAGTRDDIESWTLGDAVTDLVRGPRWRTGRSGSRPPASITQPITQPKPPASPGAGSSDKDGDGIPDRR